MKKIGRNKPSPCGSGKKYKNCCLKKDRYLKNLSEDALDLNLIVSKNKIYIVVKMKDKNKNYELYNDLVEVIELKKPEDLNNVKNGYYPDGRKFP